MKKYIVIGVVSSLFTLILVSLYFKIQIKNSTTGLFYPSPTVSLTSSSPNTTNIDTKPPLLAYIYSGNVFVVDIATKESQQITKNGSVSMVRWSKDGRWLYWFAQYQENGKRRWSFARAKYPDFKLEIFYVTDDSIFTDTNDIYAFMPLAKNNQLVIGARSGLYLVGDFSNKSGKIIKQLAKYQPLEGFDPNIKDSYGIQDIDSSEKNLLLSYCTWEMCPDIGYMNINNSKFISFPKVYGDTTGSIKFSPSGKYVLISGGTNEMIGGNPDEAVLSFPGLKTLFLAKDILKDEIDDAIFIDDSKIALTTGLGGEPGEIKAPQGIYIIDFLSKKQLSFLPTTLEKPNQDQQPSLWLMNFDSGYLYTNYNFSRFLRAYHINQSNSIDGQVDYGFPIKDGNYSLQSSMSLLK